MQTTLGDQPIQATPYDPKDWQRGNNSQKQEFDYWIEDVEGTIPPELTGTLFRNGPGILDIGGQRLQHPFDGDGMISAIAFSQGKAHYRSRFVRTEGYLAEQAAGKILHRGVFGTQKPGGWLANAFDLKLKDIANTQVIYWGNKLLALWEAASPHRLDPHTLETLGKESLNGVLQNDAAFAAHPRIDLGSNGRESRLVGFGLKPGLSTTITVYELDRSGQVVEQHAHTLPGFAFLHDFAITPNYCIFFQNPVSLNPIPYVIGLRGPGECLKFNPQQPTRIWIIPREGSGELQCLETEACFVFHHANAFERQGKIIVDSICYQDFPAIDHHLDFREIEFLTLPPGQLWRYQLDLKTRTVERRLLEKRCCEFPYIHPEQMGQPYHQVYLAAAHQLEGNAPLQAILKLDLDAGTQETWSAAPRGFVGEPVFVPRSDTLANNFQLDHSGRSTGAASGPRQDLETEGWVITLVYDAAHHRTDVVILAAERLSQGPIARLHLKHHIPYGLHGSFTPEYFGPASEY